MLYDFKTIFELDHELERTHSSDTARCQLEGGRGQMIRSKALTPRKLTACIVVTSVLAWLLFE